MIKVDAKARRVDVSQRSEEERAADAKLSREGASTVAKTAGMNSLQAALTRAGISKHDFEDLSQVALLAGAVFKPCLTLSASISKHDFEDLSQAAHSPVLYVSLSRTPLQEPRVGAIWDFVRVPCKEPCMSGVHKY